jgi:predicted Na+-dependent transporter
MAELSGQGTGAGSRDPSEKRDFQAVRQRSGDLSRGEHLWTWLLRLLLPVVLGLCVQLISWMWFNNTYGLNAWSIAGGILLILVAVPVALWAWHSWLPLEREMQTAGSGNRLQFRHIVLVLLAFAVVAGYAGLNKGNVAPPTGTPLAAEV